MKINISLIGPDENYKEISTENSIWDPVLLHFYHFVGNYLWVLGRDIRK